MSESKSKSALVSSFQAFQLGKIPLHSRDDFSPITREKHVEEAGRGESRRIDRSGAARAAPLLADKFLPRVYWLAKALSLSLPLSSSLEGEKKAGAHRGGFFLWKIFHRLATTPIGASNWLLNKQRDTWLTSTDCFLAEKREDRGPRLGHPAVSREKRGAEERVHGRGNL